MHYSLTLLWFSALITHKGSNPIKVKDNFIMCCTICVPVCRVQCLQCHLASYPCAFSHFKCQPDKLSLFLYPDEALLPSEPETHSGWDPSFELTYHPNFVYFNLTDFTKAKFNVDLNEQTSFSQERIGLCALMTILPQGREENSRAVWHLRVDKSEDVYLSTPYKAKKLNPGGSW